MSFPNHKAGKDSWDDVAERGSSAARIEKSLWLWGSCSFPPPQSPFVEWGQVCRVRSCVLKNCILTLLSENQELERGFEMWLPRPQTAKWIGKRAQLHFRDPADNFIEWLWHLAVAKGETAADQIPQ